MHNVLYTRANKLIIANKLSNKVLELCIILKSLAISRSRRYVEYRLPARQQIYSM